MPHFFFHLHDGKSRLEDRSGVSLPDAEAAWYQAYRSARDLLAGDDGPCAGRGGSIERRRWLGHSLEVEDEKGGHVWTVPIAEVVEIVT